MADTSEATTKNGCKDFDKCLEILYLMLDNEASDEQASYLNSHLDHCMICFEQYEVEKQIRQLLKTKLANQSVPIGLAQTIRNKVFLTA